MSEADAQVWQGRRRDAVVIPLDVVEQDQAIDIRLVGNHSRSGFGCPDSMTRRGDLLRQIGQRNEAHAQRSGGAFVGARRRDIGRDHEVGSIRIAARNTFMPAGSNSLAAHVHSMAMGGRPRRTTTKSTSLPCLVRQ